MNNGTVALYGFFTTQIYLQGQTLREIEIRLGFDKGKLAQGAWFAAATHLPNVGQFEFAGYSQVASHHTVEQYGNINKPQGLSEKEAYDRRQKMVIETCWALHGSNRLIKVIPMTGHTPNMDMDYQYPPGSGIPQWKAIVPVYWKGLSLVKDYPNGRFIPDEGFTHIMYI